MDFEPFDACVNDDYLVTMATEDGRSRVIDAAARGRASVRLRAAPLLPCVRLSFAGPKVSLLNPVAISAELSRLFTPGEVVEVHIVEDRVYCPTLVVPADRLRALRYCLRRVFADNDIADDWAGAHEWLDMPRDQGDAFERLLPQPDKRQLADFFRMRYARVSHSLLDPLLATPQRFTVYFHSGTDATDDVTTNLYFDYSSRYGVLSQNGVDWMPVVRRRYVGRLEVSTLTYTPFNDPENEPHWANITFGVPFKLSQKPLWRALYRDSDKTHPRNDYRVDVSLAEPGTYTVRLLDWPDNETPPPELRLSHKPRDYPEEPRYRIDGCGEDFDGTVFLPHGFSRQFPVSRPRVVTSIDQLPYACAAASSPLLYHHWDAATDELRLEPVCDMSGYDHETELRRYYNAPHPLHFEEFPLMSIDDKHYPRWPDVPEEFADFDYRNGQPLVVVYTAPPGSGKTELALQHAAHVMRRQPMPFRPRVAVIATPRVTLTLQLASQLRQTHEGVWKIAHYQDDALALDDQLPTVVVTTPYSLGKVQTLLDAAGVEIDVLVCDEFVASSTDLMNSMQDGRRIHVMECLSNALAASALTIIMDATPHLFAHGPYLGFICSAVTAPVTIRYAPLEFDEDAQREDMTATVIPDYDSLEKKMFDAVRAGRRVAAFFGSVRHLTMTAHALEACGIRTFCISNGRCDKVDAGLTLAQHLVKHGIQVLLFTSKAAHGLNIDVAGFIDDSFTFAQRGVSAEVISQAMHRVRQCQRRYIAFKKAGPARFQRSHGSCMNIMENLETENHTLLVRRRGCVSVSFPLWGLQSAWLAACRRADTEVLVSTVFAAMHRHGITRIVREKPDANNNVRQDEQDRLSWGIVREVLASIHMAASPSSRARLSSLLYLTPLEQHSPSLHSFVTGRLSDDHFVRFGLVLHFLEHEPLNGETDLHRAAEQIVDSSPDSFERSYVLMRTNLLTVARRASDAAGILRALGVRSFNGDELRVRVRGTVPAGYARASGFPASSPAVSLKQFLDRCWSRNSCRPLTNFLRATVGLGMFWHGGKKIVVSYSQDRDTALFMHLYTRWCRRRPELTASDHARHWTPPMPDPWPLAAELDIASYGDVPVCWPDDDRCTGFCHLDLPGDSANMRRSKERLSELSEEPMVRPSRLTPRHPRYSRVFGNFLPGAKFAALAELGNTGLPRFAEIATLFPDKIDSCMEGISAEERRELDKLAGL